MTHAILQSITHEHESNFICLEGERLKNVRCVRWQRLNRLGVIPSPTLLGFYSTLNKTPRVATNKEGTISQTSLIPWNQHNRINRAGLCAYFNMLGVEKQTLGCCVRAVWSLSALKLSLLLKDAVMRSFTRLDIQLWNTGYMIKYS